MPPSLYLAGPDVFLPDAAGFGARKAAICARHGLRGVFPLDPLPDESAGWAALPEAEAIARRCEAHIARCDGVIANLTPFRGPSADVGTVYEVGYARGRGLPVFGYSTVATGFTARSLAAAGAPPGAGPGWRDRDGMAIEWFDLADNLMIPGGLTVLVAEDAADRWTDLAAFERCVAAAARHFAVPPA